MNPIVVYQLSCIATVELADVLEVLCLCLDLVSPVRLIG